MNANEFILAVDHADGMNDRWLFLAAYCLLLIGCGVVIADHKELRESHHDALTQIIDKQNETALKLAVYIDGNPEALRERTFELSRFRDRKAW